MEWLEHFILLHSEKQEILSVREKQEGALLQDIFLQPYLGLGPALVLQWTLHGSSVHPAWPFIEHYLFLNFCIKV